MVIFLFLIPVLALGSGVWLYRKTGKKEVLKLDVVQFIYAFLLAPMLFVWFKSFLFYLLKQEFGSTLSLTDLFLIDTVYSLVFMVSYAFVVIHSLTKSFEVKRYVDPLYDVFQHSYNIQLWMSHFGIYLGGMTLITFVSIVNVFLPLTIIGRGFSFYLLLLGGFICGLTIFGGIWLSVFNEKFLKLMKLMFGLFFFLHVGIYFIVEPEFSLAHAMYWFVFMIFVATVLLSLFLEKSDRAMTWMEKFHHKIGWSAKKKKYLLSK